MLFQNGTTLNNTCLKPCVFFSANIQGLYSRGVKHKTSFLAEMAADENAIFLALTETHLSPDVYDAEVEIPGFEIFRSDRKHASRGGVCLYVKNDIKSDASLLKQESIGNIESLVVYLRRLNTVIIVVYRPPTALENDFSDIVDGVQRTLEDLPDDIPFPTIFMTGDFNFPAIQWTEGDMGLATTNLRRQFQCLQQFTADNFLNQVIETPTRGNNILD